MTLNIEENLSFEVSPQEWQSVKPHKGSRLLRKGWSEIMASHLKECVPSCSVSFKWHYLTWTKSSRTKNFFTALAKCKVQGCTDFLLTIKKKPHKHSETPVKVNIKVKSEIRHPAKSKHKRQLRGRKRKEVQEKMQTKKPSELF